MSRLLFSRLGFSQLGSCRLGDRRSRTPAPFSPLSLLTTDGFYFNFAEAVKYQEIAESNLVTTAGQRIGVVHDLGSYGFDASAVSDTFRPVWDPVDGSADFAGGPLYQLFVGGCLPNNDGHSYMARFRANVAVAGTQVLIGSASLSNRAWISLTTGVASMGVGGNGSDATKDPAATDLRSATAFHTIAGTWDDTTLNLYVDGAAVLRDGRLAGVVNDFAPSIGRRNTTSGGTSGDNFLTGEITHAFGIRRKLSDAEVLALHENWTP